jgi:hypothetical protein
MDATKGVGRIVLTCLHASKGEVQLVRFADGSLSVRVDGSAVSVWEPFEQEDGMRSYFALVEFGRPPAPGEPPDLLLLRSG